MTDLLAKTGDLRRLKTGRMLRPSATHPFSSHLLRPFDARACSN